MFLRKEKKYLSLELVSNSGLGRPHDLRLRKYPRTQGGLFAFDWPVHSRSSLPDRFFGLGKTGKKSDQNRKNVGSKPKKRQIELKPGKSQSETEKTSDRNRKKVRAKPKKRSGNDERIKRIPLFPFFFLVSCFVFSSQHEHHHQSPVFPPHHP